MAKPGAGSRPALGTRPPGPKNEVHILHMARWPHKDDLPAAAHPEPAAEPRVFTGPFLASRSREPYYGAFAIENYGEDS